MDGLAQIANHGLDEIGESPGPGLHMETGQLDGVGQQLRIKPGVEPAGFLF
ncbi:MAG: hypothetical protein ACOY4W_00805 [Thermodesulfobacteriota bacterium]